MPFFKLDELPAAVVSPGHSSAYGPTVTGRELEIGVYAEPKGSGEQQALEDGTRFVSFKTATGTQPVGE